MSRTLPPWLVAGLLLCMLAATIEALIGYILDLRSWGTLAPRFREDTYADGFGPEGW